MKPDRDMDPPDQYNRKKTSYEGSISLEDFIKQTLEDHQNIYRAGMNLPPLKESPSADSSESSHSPRTSGEPVIGPASGKADGDHT